MKGLLKGIVIGGGFAATYYLSNIEPVDRFFLSLGGAYHVARALVMFSIGYWLRALSPK